MTGTVSISLLAPPVLKSKDILNGIKYKQFFHIIAKNVDNARHI